MVPRSFDEAFEQVKGLAARFAENESAYLDPRYQEAEVRQDFLDRFFVALGWDVYHHEHPNPYEREVRIEKTVHVETRGKKADYAFYTAPNYHQARFMAEAKKPSRQLENAVDCFQAMRYGWNSNTPLAVLTDFEQFLVLDSRYKPSVERSLNGIIDKFHYSEFADEEAFRRIYYLFSREAVADNSLDKFIAGLKKVKAAKAAKVAPAVQIEPVGDTFLTELDEHRAALAGSFKRARPELEGEALTEITQRTLDRLVFIRFLEDKLVEPSEIIDRLGRRSGDAWTDFAAEMPRLNQIYNGIIFKPHEILDASAFRPEGKAFDETVAWLSHRNSAYDFNTIPIHILGSIYERFLGKTITVTDKRAKVEEKPEVRKAGGVYYTPEYIVTYIVENTVGKLIEGRTPDEIAKMRFADIACGSGSFLLGIFDCLIKYHVEWYSWPGPQASSPARVRQIDGEWDGARSGDSGALTPEEPALQAGTPAVQSKRRRDALKAGLIREGPDGGVQLTLEHKRDILLNNIYGVDLDAQAVEVAQLSLYLKLLEEETAGTVQPKLGGLREQLLPSLNKNIVHGNSLIDFDIMDTPLFGGGVLQKPARSKGTRDDASSAESKGQHASVTATEAAATVPLLRAGFSNERPTDTDALRKLNPMNFETMFPEVFRNGGFDAIVGNPPYVRQEMISDLKPYFQRRYKTYHGVADLYVYFFERYTTLLKNAGEFGIIVANKWLRARYGEPLRKWLKDLDIREIIDFGDLRVFQGASTYPAILRVRNQKTQSVFDVTIVQNLDFDGKSLTDYVLSNKYPVTQIESSDGGWSLSQDAIQFLLGRFFSIGQPLRQYVGGKIFYGVKTGLNEAFVIDRDTKECLIKEDVGSENLIKPFLFGRDIKRYETPSNEKFLIFTRRGTKLSRYPAIENYLRQYFARLSPRPKNWEATAREKWPGRKPGSYKWYEIQDTVDYFAEFETTKIAYAEIATRGQFILDETGSYLDTTGFILGSSDRYLLGLLNSRLFTFIASRISSTIRGGFLRWKAIYMSVLPIRTINFDDPDEKALHDRVVDLVGKIIEAKKQQAGAGSEREREFYERMAATLDRQIDDLVYKLYDITDDERRIIEAG